MSAPFFLIPDEPDRYYIRCVFGPCPLGGSAKFSTLEELEHHRKRQHPSSRPYIIRSNPPRQHTCLVFSCKYSTSSKSQWKQHMKILHNWKDENSQEDTPPDSEEDEEEQEEGYGSPEEEVLSYPSHLPVLTNTPMSRGRGESLNVGQEAHGEGNETEESGKSVSDYLTCYSRSATVFTASTSTGIRSRPGATWQGTRTLNHSSGFAGGAPYSANYKGVREGREDPDTIYSVGRTGKPPAAVPLAMIRAMRTLNEDEDFDRLCQELASDLDKLKAFRENHRSFTFSYAMQYQGDLSMCIKNIKHLRNHIYPSWQEGMSSGESDDKMQRRQNKVDELSGALDRLIMGG